MAKTDGVPLFVEELTKMVLESGLLQEREDRYELTGPLPPLAIPATLHDSLMARLDRLAAVKGLAQLGATLGREFSYALLQAVSPWDEATLQRGLQQLVEAEFLYQQGLPPQATYLFKHALIQDAAYQSLLRSTRQQYHQRIAQVLEARFPEVCETQPELLAHHYTEAGLMAQAIPYWQRAGQRALQRSANLEAMAHLTKGLEVLATLPDTPERAQQELVLQTTLGPALIATKGYAAPEVLHAYARARELCQQVGETPQLFQVLRGLWYFYLIRVELQTARELGEQLLTLAQQVGDPALRLEAHYALGNTLNYLGEFAAAQAHFAQGMLDLPGLESLLSDLGSRRISLVEVETASASPFASSLLFDYVATYMYEGDTPNAERRAAALALDRDLLRELLGQEELRELIDPEALVSVEAWLQYLNDEIRARDRDALQQILRRLGDLTEEECQERVGEALSASSMLSKLLNERRAAKVRVNGEERWIAAEDAGLYRDALGVPPPPGLPESFGEEVPDAMSSLVRRWAQTHGPFPTRRLADRYGIDPMPALRELEREGILVRGELLPGGTEREWCDSEVLRRVRRASLAQLRQEAEAVDPAELARFLPSWQNVDAHRPAGAGPDRLREALVPMQGVALTPEVWERDVLPRRLGAYNPAWLDQLTTRARSSGSAPARSRAQAGSPSTSATTCGWRGLRPRTPSWRSRPVRFTT